MNPKFEKLLEKKRKEGKKLSDVEQEAKLGVVHDMKQMAMDEMGNSLNGLKKISVASDSKEGLKKGLGKAEELLEKPEMSHDEEGESLEEEASESPEEEEQELESGKEKKPEDMDAEELQKHIDELMRLKEQKDKMA